MAHVVRTACTRDCPDACQILATVDEGRVVALRGDPRHPVTKGFLCYRTDHYLERQYSSERITEPLIRKNGVLTPASWDEALSLVAEKLREARDRHGAESIFHYQSGGSLGLLKLLNRKFFEALGPVTHKRGDICSGAGDAAQKADMGAEDAHDLDDLVHSRAIVLWGKNVAETSVHLIPFLKAARARGVPIVQIDPVHNRKTLALADAYYPVRPGGDGYLALGIARALFDAGAVDPAAATYCDGYDAFRALAERHDVDGWAARADLPPSSVRALAELYGRRKPAALFVGWGLGRRLHGSATIRLLDALGAVSGNLGVRGGGVSYYFQRRGGFDTSFIKRKENAGARTLLEPLLGEELLRADPKVRVAIVDNGNPVSQLPDSTTVARGFSAVDFLVVLDAFLTDTAELAHVVLPTTTMLEEHDVVGAYGHAHVQLAQPVVPPPGGARSDLAIYQDLAARLGFGEALAGTAEEWIDRMLLPTASGRFQLIDDFPDEAPALEEGYPLHLLSISTYRSQSSQLSLASQAEPPRVIVHPATAGGKRAGDRARLVSPLGSVEVTLELDERQREDVVIFHKGRWAKRGGPNTLVRARETDAGGGAAYYDQGVRLE